MCIGSLYAWSGFNTAIERYLYDPPIVNGTLVDLNIAPVTFYIAVAFLGLTAAILGPWLERNGPLKGVLLGATLFTLGNLGTALGVYLKSIAVIYISYGVVGGMGLGIGYISPVSPLQKWFPDCRGIAAGFAGTWSPCLPIANRVPVM